MRKLAVLVISISIALSSCNKNKVNLLDTNAQGEIPSLGNLTFTFDKNLCPDSLLNYWDSTAYIVFQPKIQGRFRWQNANELVFSPEFELPPATTFKASVSKEILRHSKFSLGKCQIKDFHTPHVKLENIFAMWNVAEGTTNNAFPQIDLSFNYKVNPTQLNDLLSVEINGEKKDINIQTINAESKISVTIMNLKMEDKDLTGKVSISKGLLPEGGATGTSEDTETTFSLTSPYTLSILNLEADHDGAIGTVKIFTSQPVIAENLDNFISISPAVSIKSEIVSDGLVLSSEEFDVSKSYSLVLKKGMRGKIGGVLKEEYTNTLVFGKLQPRISFVNRKGVYVGAKGSKNIEVLINSISKVKVIVSKIYESNLLFAQSHGYYPNDNSYSDYEYEGDYYGEYGSEGVYGDIIYEQEIDTKTLQKRGASRLFKFNIEDKLKDFKGIYHIKIRSTEDYWLDDSRFISLSDIGLIAKQTEDKVVVFANSIQSAGAINGVTINVIGNNNQNIGSGTTNSDGVAEISLKRKDFDGFKAALIVAKVGDDFNYLPFRSTRVNTSRFEVGGKRSNTTGLDAFVYSERDIYRPGEKINFSVIVRDWKWKKPGEVPLKLKFLLPNGKELKSIRKTLNDEGSLETQIELSPAAVTGNYTLEVYNGNDVLLTSNNVHVEEFMPDRIKLTTSIDKKFLKPGETATLLLNAVNFFGPPAANRKYEVEIQVKGKSFSPEKYNRFNFWLTDRNADFETNLTTGVTDAGGNATVNYVTDANYVNRGVLQADFFSTVFDETGRPVNRKNSIDIFTQDVFYGIGNEGFYYYGLNQKINFPIIALNKDEQPLNNAQAHIQVIKHDYKTVLSRYNEYFRYESQREDKTLVDQNVMVNGEQTVFSYVPRTPGEYEVRIAKPGTNTYVSQSFYSYGYMSGGYGNFEVDNEGQIDIEPDRKEYNSGDKCKVLFKTPFNGKMLVTLENNQVISHQYVTVEGRAASVEFNLSAQHLPNAYITATLIKPHTESDMPLTVAHGFKSVSVLDHARKIPVQINAEKNVRSRSHQKVSIKAAPNSKVTVAVVDEGILQITNYKTPDPFGFFYAKRALEVNSYDLYPLLFPELGNTLSSTGGDGFDMSKRTNPLQNKRVKLVSYWSGIMDASGSGSAEFEFDVPQFSGQLRIMAVAYKNESFGSADVNMTVADPVVISAAVPRFLSPKDTLLMPVTVSNTTKNNTSAIANVKTAGPLKVVGPSQQNVNLKAGSETKVEFKLIADARADAAKVTIEVNSMGQKFLDETDITVRPAASVQKISEAGAIAGGSTKRIELRSDIFIPSSADYQLIVSKNPGLEIADQIYQLIGYPYGCTEQTISKAFPQLYFADLAESMKLDKGVKVNANFNVQEAIRKIKMRQLYSGAITLWDQEGTENWWATAYAAHFLLEAQKAGFDVETSLLDNIFKYLNTKLKNKDFTTYYYNQNLKKQIAPKEVAYSLYVLALAGKPQISTMNYYKQNSTLLALDSKYLLSVAFALAGDKARYRELLPSSFAGETAAKENGGSFSSDVRDEGVALAAILEVEPGNAQVGTMAKHLSREIKSRAYLSTQERAFAFIALGKIARQANSANVAATIKVNGKEIAKCDGSLLRLNTKQLGNSAIEISVAGEGKMYYFWQAEGISADGMVKEEDSFLKVRRKFYNRNGTPITNGLFNQNDLIIVGLTLEKSYSGTVENIVVTDMLPAGFEIENSRLKELPDATWIKNESTPEHTDMRDDRIHFFTSLVTSSKTFYYSVRAVSTGNFVLGPAMADAMYQGEYHSYNGAGKIVVK
jgi:uncharacterized protein YfaS (alpha-2-macroglobulin family)